jgi:hypothetical protein
MGAMLSRAARASEGGDPGRLAAVLHARAPDLPWEAKNQAAVHLWYPRRFGVEVAPFARHNPTRVPATFYERRLAEKDWPARWPKLRTYHSPRPPG